jgi:hypothetical protein
MFAPWAICFGLPGASDRAQASPRAAMTIKTSLCSALVASVCLFAGGETAQQGPATIYLLHDARKGLWCGYHDEQAWRMATKNAGAIETASVDFVRGIPKVVKVTMGNKLNASDWVVFDRYYLNDAGLVMGLQRTTNVFADDVSRKEVLEARNGGHLSLQHVKLFSFQSGSPLLRTSAAFPAPPVTTRMVNFPFAALAENPHNLLVLDSVCVPPHEVTGDPRDRQ